MTELKIRANTLEVNDLFIKQNTTYRVVKIDQSTIYIKNQINSAYLQIGAKSMEWVIWVGKYAYPVKPPPKPPKRKLNPKKKKIPVAVYSKIGGEKIGEYPSIRRAEAATGISYKYIERYVKKELVKPLYPHHFEKIVEPQNNL